VTGEAELVAAAHEAFERRQWAVARERFNAAGKTARLTADDCYAWAEAAWCLGAIDESLSTWAKAYELLPGGRPAAPSRNVGDVSSATFDGTRRHRCGRGVDEPNATTPRR